MERIRRISAARDATRFNRWVLTSILFVAALMYLASARADDTYLIVNGRAIHFNERPGVPYNENNWGLGFQHDMAGKHDAWIPFITASGFRDSNRNPSYYAGGGLLRRYFFDADDARLHVDAGAVGFMMIRKGYKGGDPFFGVLPAFSFGSDKVSVNVTYIPKVEPKSVPLLFFQLKVSLDVFK